MCASFYLLSLVAILHFFLASAAPCNGEESGEGRGEVALSSELVDGSSSNG